MPEVFSLEEIRARILEEALVAKNLEPEEMQRELWQKEVDRLASEFIEGLPSARTFHDVGREDLLAITASLDQAQTLPELLQLVKEGVSATGLQTAGPGHLAFIPGGGLYAGALADHLASTLNPFSADAFSAPFAAHLHNQVIHWLTQLVGYGQGAYGDLTSGGSIATLTAFHAARRATSIRSYDIPKLCVYVGEHTHHCCMKAMHTLFGEEIQIRSILSPDKDSYILDPDKLNIAIAEDRAKGLKPWLIVATAGSTNLGCVDPLKSISEIARQEKIWLHVDAAYGGFFKILPELSPLFEGLECADSIVLDPHKSLFLPYGSGIVLLKDGSHLRNGTSGPYLQDRSSKEEAWHSPMDHSLELTRPFRALRVWLPWRLYGEEVLGAALREKLLLTRYCADLLREIPGLKLITEPDLSVIGFYLELGTQGSDELTSELLRRINRHPEVFLSSTRVRGRLVIRVAILSFRTHLERIDRLLAIIRDEAQSLVQKGLS